MLSVMRAFLIVLHLTLGIAAVGAGQAFVRKPDGTALGMTVERLNGSPFRDYRVPGLFLAIVIGGANLVSGLALWRRHEGAAAFSFATGVLLMAWITVQTAIIGFFHWSQAVWWATFGLLTLVAATLYRETNRKARSA
jgi:hypothetical protein